MSQGNRFCVRSSKCSAGYKVSQRDLQASDSSSSSPQQGGLEAVHGLPKVVFLASLTQWRFLRLSLLCYCRSYGSRWMLRVVGLGMWYGLYGSCLCCLFMVPIYRVCFVFPLLLFLYAWARCSLACLYITASLNKYVRKPVSEEKSYDNCMPWF
jgi:hypothetical protein